MSGFTSSFLQTLEQRGFIHQMTDADGIDEKLSAGIVTAYVGYDCTAPSLHVGNLVSIMMLKWLQETGHKPVILLGGGTTRIGDPSGKDQSRQLLDDAAIKSNMASIKKAFERFVTFGDGPTDAVMVNNADWLDSLGYVDFLRLVGPHFTINRMLTFDSVKLRLDREQPLSFIEFNYMILQAYDFVKLAKTENVSLQMGGSDQWGNIVNGIELARRIEGRSLFGLTTPLMTTADGKKMGKSVDGAVWLNDDALPAYDYWQFWRNSADADVVRFLKLYTMMDIEEIASIEEAINSGDGKAINDAKVRLADEATALCRGEEAAAKARATAEATFAGGMGEDLPTITLSTADLAQGRPIVDLYVDVGLADSKGAARRLMRQGGAKLNGEAIKDENRVISADDIKDGEAKLSAGKKKHARILIG